MQYQSDMAYDITMFMFGSKRIHTPLLYCSLCLYSHTTCMPIVGIYTVIKVWGTMKYNTRSSYFLYGHGYISWINPSYRWPWLVWSNTPIAELYDLSNIRAIGQVNWNTCWLTRFEIMALSVMMGRKDEERGREGGREGRGWQERKK